MCTLVISAYIPAPGWVLEHVFPPCISFGMTVGNLGGQWDGYSPIGSRLIRPDKQAAGQDVHPLNLSI